MILWYGKQSEGNIEYILNVWKHKTNRCPKKILQTAMVNGIIKTECNYNI